MAREKEGSQIATAAYNFISLPDQILPSPIDEDDELSKILIDEKQNEVDEKYREYLKKANLEGYIDLTFETLTPFFLGEGSFSYAPNGTPIIPGSSIRGMVKNIFKIITLGAMRPDVDFKNHYLYYRCIMEGPYKCGVSLHKLYSQRMNASKGEDKKICPGFIIKTPNGYFICPMKQGETAKRVLIKEYVDKFHKEIKENMKDVRVDWNGAVAYAISGSREDKQKYNKKTRKPVGPRGLFKTMGAYEDYKKNTHNIWDKQAIGKQFVREFQLSSVDFEEASRIPIDDRLIQEYLDDKNRRGVDLLNLDDEIKKSNLKSGVIAGEILREKFPDAPADIERIAPCYYLLKGGRVEGFGHGQHFRIPYNKSIDDAVPGEMKKGTIDFTDAVFGLVREGKSFWGSRVFFEDACLEGKALYEQDHHAHALLSPNPTSYQLYLQQDSIEDLDELNHWDSDGAKIRGYKMYWHNAEKHAWWASPEEIEATGTKADKKNDEQILKVIRPIKKGSRFNARIRFSNLTPKELGALMMVFHLENAKNLAYKLGKGKAIGLGSVRIVQKRLLVEDKDKYGKLFTSGGWNNPCVKQDEDYYLEEFRKYIREKSDLENTWHHIMGELAAMLEWRDEWDTGDVSERWQRAIKGTKYKQNKNNGKWSVDFIPFLRRDVLPTVEDVIKEGTKKP